MAKAKVVEKTEDGQVEKVVSIHDIEWSDYVLSLLTDDEKIEGNPTTDGLRRIFEKALNCEILESTANVVQSPEPNNEKRATVVYTISYFIKNSDSAPECRVKTVSGAADVYWGNCDKVYRNHPVAVAETRAEGRALRRALRLRKVVAAEELASNVEDDPTGDSVSKISSTQINFIDVMSRRLNINPNNLLTLLNINKNIKHLMHDEGVLIIRELSKHQQNVDDIPDSIRGYVENWKED